MLPVDRATLHAAAHLAPWQAEGHYIGPVLAELPIPESGTGWVQSELHEGPDAGRAIALWHNGAPIWVSGERTVKAGDWVGIELPITVGWEVL